MTNDERRLGSEWAGLQEAGEVPGKGKGTTAERAARDVTRKRRRTPTEDRRVGRKIAPTLSVDLIRRLRAICETEGYVGESGEGVIASPVIEDLLWVAVGAYERGELECVEEVVEVRRRLERAD